MNPFDPGAAKDFFDRTRGVAFDPSVATYHRGNARWLAELSRLMYVRDTKARARFLPSGLVHEKMRDELLAAWPEIEAQLGERKPIHRVVNKRDPITLVPRIQKYAEAGTPQQFSAQGELPQVGLQRFLPAFIKPLFDARMIDQVAKRVRALSPIDLADHDPLVYVKNV